MEGLAYHPIAAWWRDLVGQGIWTELFSSVPVVVFLIIGLLILPKLTKFIFKIILIAAMILAILVAAVIFNPFGIADAVLGLL